MSYTPVSLQEHPTTTTPTTNVTAHHHHELQETLISVPSATTVMASTTPMLQVVAPANLPEGYELEASIGGTTDNNNNNNNNTTATSTIKVKVPPGGVEKGQVFAVPFPAPMESRFLATSTIQIPVGHWRDGIFEFYKYGVCHPHCWTSCCCSTLGVGQVINRLNLNWMGNPATTSGQAAAAFSIILAIVLVYYVVRVTLGISLWLADDDDDDDGGKRTQSFDYDEGNNNNNNNNNWQDNEKDKDEDDDDPDDGDIFFLLIWSWFGLFWIILCILLTNVRRTVRERYGIPPSSPLGELEDPVVSCCCSCFATGQLLRHTTEYETYPATCCTRTGIPPTAPSIA